MRRAFKNPTHTHILWGLGTNNDIRTPRKIGCITKKTSFSGAEDEQKNNVI